MWWYVSIFAVGLIAILLWRTVGTSGLSATVSTITGRIPGGGEWLQYVVAGVVLLFALFLFFPAVAPLWAAGYKEAGGPVWLLLLGVAAVGAIVAKTSGTLRGALLTLVGGLVGLTVVWFLAVGLVYKPACLPDDTDCRAEIVAAEEAADEKERLRLAAQAVADWRRVEEIRLALKEECSREDPDYYFAPQPDVDHPVNPGGNCVVVIDVPEGMCFYVRERSFKFAGVGHMPKKGPYGRCPENIGRNLPTNIEVIWSAHADPKLPDGGGYWGTVEFEPRGS